ncbi:unnamed protein product [Orchesella dallaii]|uniref:RING-type domain-containing protein n=1 Tax=Orchesella dallaii TaxID=48710 RepID=A0ABP1Q5P8_9HEXA
MAPERRYRRASSRWLRPNYARHLDETIAGQSMRRVMDSYCPYCATDIRAVGPRRMVRCPNISLCGKPLPLDENTCPNCTHYIRTGDNFCRVCRTNLRNVIRGRGGLYQQLHRAPSPLRNTSPPRPEPSEAGDESSSEEEGEHGVVEGDAGNQGPANNIGGGEGGRNRAAVGQGGGGFLRVVAIDDGE